jgi:hypothetical protein
VLPRARRVEPGSQSLEAGQRGLQLHARRTQIAFAFVGAGEQGLSAGRFVGRFHLRPARSRPAQVRDRGGAPPLGELELAPRAGGGGQRRRRAQLGRQAFELRERLAGGLLGAGDQRDRHLHREQGCLRLGRLGQHPLDRGEGARGVPLGQAQARQRKLRVATPFEALPASFLRSLEIAEAQPDLRQLLVGEVGRAGAGVQQQVAAGERVALGVLERAPEAKHLCAVDAKSMAREARRR